MKKFFIALSFFALFSCKNDKNNDNKVQGKEIVKNEFFKIKLAFIAKKDDTFHVFYTEDGSQNFNQENSKWVGFKGSDSSQKIIFDLPKEIIPNQLRIDFGFNKEQGDVKINSLEMSYYGKVTTISGADFFKFFRPNEGNTVIDIPNQTLKALIKSNQEFSGPSVYPLEPLTKEIEKITQ